MRMLLPVFLAIFFVPGCIAAAKRACLPPNDAQKHSGKDICVTAHIYRIVDAPHGIHFLDVCSPQTADADCHFFLLSMDRDRKEVGDLHRLIGRTLDIRGTPRMVQGRAEIVLHDRRQLHGGKEPFHPNPRLTKSFSAENSGRAFSSRNGRGGQSGVHFSHRGR